MVVLAILVREEKEGMSEEKEAREGEKKVCYSRIGTTVRSECLLEMRILNFS